MSCIPMTMMTMKKVMSMRKGGRVVTRKVSVDEGIGREGTHFFFFFSKSS